MDKRNLKWITWGFVGVTVLIVALMLGNTLRRTSYVTLPQIKAEDSQISDDSGVSSDALTVVEVTPETVQAAIATLARPAVYSRMITVEQFWEDGSAAYEVAVAVSGEWTRMDRNMPDGRVRHVILGAEEDYIWYSNENVVYSSAAGIVSADQEQTIPTYEEVLELPVDMIAGAAYRMISDVDCIYVETVPDELGYVSRYWVSVDTGLLTVAEKLLEEKPVYRMAALEMEQAASAAAFTLPDGTILNT